MTERLRFGQVGGRMLSKPSFSISQVFVMHCHVGAIHLNPSSYVRDGPTLASLSGIAGLWYDDNGIIG